MKDPYRVICYTDSNFAVEKLVGDEYETMEIFGKGEDGFNKAVAKRNELFTKINYSHEQ